MGPQHQAPGPQNRPSGRRGHAAAPFRTSADTVALVALAVVALLGLLGVLTHLRDLDALAFIGATCVVLLLVRAVCSRNQCTEEAGGRCSSCLERALGGGALELHYQPQVTLSGEAVGMEALLRRRRPGGRPESAVALIERAEHRGLMPWLTRYVLDTAVAQAAAWHKEGLAVPVSVNISPTDALVPGFCADVRACLRRHGLPGRALTVEVTESASVPDVPALAAALAELRGQGVRISLDDFGTGHSSITRLRELPVDELKIDRSFVSRMADDPRDAAVIRCSVGLAHSLGLGVVAEGVETRTDLRLLECMGVTVIQGWFVSPALAATEATGWLRRAATAASAG
ncbi:EAL domain-containing protein [Streptomyces sp. NPDC006487]|uniref:EAL domain-containing protein n=1 Tax=Streptomyces sp. NPDC006487 TaxID=3364748 RepID=UPI0036C8481D